MGNDKLKEVLEQHKLWLETEGEEGVKADLRYANIRGASLSVANLCGTQF